MKANDVLIYLSDLLNINITNDLIMEDILDDLKSIHDLALFREFLKSKFNYERYKYLTGYQKFVAMCNDFKKDFQPTLTEEQNQAVGNYADELYRRTITLFDEINWLVQVGEDLESDKIKGMIYNTFGKREKDIKVLKKIGDKAKLLKMCNNSKGSLRNKIYEVVHSLTVEKTYPQLQHKSKDALLLERLK